MTRQEEMLLAQIEALEVRNKELETLAMEDELTGVYNRRGFMHLAEKQLKLAQRNGEPCTLLFLDLDDFKQINDKFGHPTGDVAIQMFTKILESVLRISDILGRYGGDEFVILLPNTKNGNVEYLIERIREVLANEWSLRYTLSASIGFSTYENHGRCDLGNMIEEACNLMYKEKKSKKLA